MFCFVLKDFWNELGGTAGLYKYRNRHWFRVSAMILTIEMVRQILVLLGNGTDNYRNPDPGSEVGRRYLCLWVSGMMRHGEGYQAIEEQTF